MSNLDTHLKQLLKNHWGFLDEGWPTVEQQHNHRTAVKPVEHIKLVKETLVKRLGPIPVFFFLVTLWPYAKYPGPYREVEKGLLILYHLTTGVAMDGISPHMPKSSFHALYSQFYKTHFRSTMKQVNDMMAKMFSTFPIRVLCAKEKNPELFRHVTLHIDGHDTRLTCEEKSSSEMYSYKLKKSGVRTQVCIDPNGMAILVSKSLPCKDNGDGTMLVGMKIHRHIHELDCIAIDGGYTQYIGKIVAETDMSKRNFCYPIRRSRGKSLAEDEANYNKTFGSFRSQMEAEFGELGTVFEMHNNRKPVRVNKIETYNLQLRLCLLLMNVKRMVAIFGIKDEPIHRAWITENFDYPSNNGVMEQIMECPPVAEMLADAESLSKLQDDFMNMEIMEVDDEEEEQLTRKRVRVVGVDIPSMKRIK